MSMTLHLFVRYFASNTHSPVTNFSFSLRLVPLDSQRTNARFRTRAIQRHESVLSFLFFFYKKIIVFN